MVSILKGFFFCFLFINGGLAFSKKDIEIEKIAQLPKFMYETSGLAFLNDHIITHNDGGNKAELFVLNKKGKYEKTIQVEGVQNNDWEDIALDEEKNLYIGDFGNNANSRKNLQIHIVKSGFIGKEKVTTRTIHFTYEDQQKFPPKEKELEFDCEAFIVKGGKIFLFTKCRTKPYTGISKIYILPNRPGNYEAKLIGQFQFCDNGWLTCSVTAADYHHASNTLAILTYGRLYLITDFMFNAFWKGKIKKYKIPKVKQREAICFLSDHTWLITDEYRKGLKGGDLYKMKFKKK
ncbi:hypothetical protein DNU06_13685 [Putridiphycobacter roseus]|uniref:SdiA-regulated family protein n=1 Tax=Putridiphycobacter roseus TaxID=2219161 RepID=A0A2W1MW80_9FLAO|nr:hypothetical protein [Putridiphycobacter roseus]PZE16359.1 hypothetical protein DNU06_13685 [Putridiphycobacter roseus]